MSKKLFLFSALLLASSLFFVTSCKKDCSFNQKDYVGQYLVTEDCSVSQAASYNVTVSAGASEVDMKLTNVWQFFTNSVNATINCETISIPRQEPDGDKFFVEGSGTISKDNGTTTITFTYTVTDETDPGAILSDVCTSTIYTKL